MTGALLLLPSASGGNTPTSTGQMAFQLTNSFQLTIKVMGYDGVIRSATLALS